MLSQLGVPLAQGWLFGRPAPPWADLRPEESRHITDLVRRTDQHHRIASLAERAATISEDELGDAAGALRARPDVEHLVAVDDRQRAVCVVRRALRLTDRRVAHHLLPVSLSVVADADVADVAARAMTRDSNTRFDPILCTGPDGDYFGLVRAERLMVRLAELSALQAS